MKLIFAIVSDEDSPRLMAEVNRAGYRVTKLHSTGGFLRSGNTTLMAVVDVYKRQDNSPFRNGSNSLRTS